MPWAVDSLSAADHSAKEAWSLKRFPFLVPAPSNPPSSSLPTSHFSPLLPLVVSPGPRSLPQPLVISLSLSL